MNGILVSRLNMIPAASIVPSNNNVVSRAVIAGNKARCCIPLYPGIALGDGVSLWIATNGDWNFGGNRLVVSLDNMLEFTLFDALFAAPATTATVSYTVNGGTPSESSIYTIVD